MFGAGTVQWAWGLDSTNPVNGAVDRNMQQATVNLFADMGVQPASCTRVCRRDHVDDTTPPTSTITSPGRNANVADGAQVTVSGTATDTGGGVVGGVEVSTDGGDLASWHDPPRARRLVVLVDRAGQPHRQAHVPGHR